MLAFSWIRCAMAVMLASAGIAAASVDDGGAMWLVMLALSMVKL